MIADFPSECSRLTALEVLQFNGTALTLFPIEFTRSLRNAARLHTLAATLVTNYFIPWLNNIPGVAVRVVRSFNSHKKKSFTK